MIHEPLVDGVQREGEKKRGGKIRGAVLEGISLALTGRACIGLLVGTDRQTTSLWYDSPSGSLHTRLRKDMQRELVANNGLNEANATIRSCCLVKMRTRSGSLFSWASRVRKVHNVYVYPSASRSSMRQCGSQRAKSRTRAAV